MSRLAALKIVSFLWLGSILGAGCAFLTQVLLARELGPAAFGVFAAALSMVTLGAPLASFGVGSFWLKAFGQEGWQAVRWLRGSFAFTAVSTMMVLAALFTWAMFGPHDATTAELLFVLSVYLLGQIAVELLSAKLQLEERYLGLVLWQFLPHLLRLLLVTVLAFMLVNMMTLHTVAYAYALISIGFFAIGAFLLRRMYHGGLLLRGHGAATLCPIADVPHVGIRQVMGQTWPFGLAGVFHLIYFQSDIILLKYIAGDEAAGMYNVAFVIMTAVYILPSVIYQKFLLPKIHRWANHDRARFYQVYRTGNWMMLVLGLLSMLLIWLLAPWGIQLLFGEHYVDAVLPLGILALAAPIYFVATSVGSTLTTQEHMKRKVKYMGIVALVNFSLNIFMINIWGGAGAAAATVMSYFVLLLLYFHASRVYVFTVELSSGNDLKEQ